MQLAHDAHMSIRPDIREQSRRRRGRFARLLGVFAILVGISGMSMPTANAAVSNTDAMLFCVRQGAAGGYSNLLGSYTNNVTMLQTWMIHENSQYWVRVSVAYSFYDANGWPTGQVLYPAPLWAPPNQTTSSTILGYFDSSGRFVFTRNTGLFTEIGLWRGPHVIAAISFYDSGTHLTTTIYRFSTAC